MTLNRPKTFAILAALALIAVAEDASAESLQEAMVAAYLTNPTLDAQRAQLRATDETVPLALSGWRPTIIGEASGGHEWAEVERPIGVESDYSPRRVGVGVSQPVFSGFRTTSSTSAAESSVLAERARLTDVEQQVLLSAVGAYMAVVRDLAVLEVNRNNEKVLAAQLEATQIRFEVGEVTRTDVAQAESRYQLAIAQRIAAEGQVTSSESVYRQVVGSAPVDLKMPGDIAVLPQSVDEIVFQSVEAPSVIASQFDQDAAKHNIDVAFADLLPSVSIEGSYQHEEDTSSNDQESNVGTVLGQVTIPLYQAGAPDARVRESKQRYQLSRRRVDEALRQAEQEAVDAWQAMETAAAQTTSFEEQVKATQIALEGVRQEQEVGARTVLDVLDAEQEALDAKVSLISAQTDRVVAQYRILAAIGRLTVADLALESPLYDPLEHYNKVRNKFWGVGESVE